MSSYVADIYMKVAAVFNKTPLFFPNVPLKQNLAAYSVAEVFERKAYRDSIGGDVGVRSAVVEGNLVFSVYTPHDSGSTLDLECLDQIRYALNDTVIPSFNGYVTFEHGRMISAEKLLNTPLRRTTIVFNFYYRYDF